MSSIKRGEYIEMLHEGVISSGVKTRRENGAPKGGRVHWLLWNLTPDFKGKYVLHYDYKYNNYVFLRYRKRKLYDIFIVMRTSVHGWRCMYFNAYCLAFERCSTRKSNDMARCLMLIEETYGKSYPQDDNSVCITEKPPETPYKQRVSSGCDSFPDDRE